MNKDKEIQIRVSGDEAVTFRKFLSKKKGINNYMNVDPNVILYSDKGISVTQGFESGKPYDPILKVFGIATKLKSVANVAKVVKGAVSVAQNVSEADGGGISWIPWIQNINSFKDAKPFTVNLSFEFHMGEFGLWDAEEEVVKPVLNLMAIFIPKGITGMNIIPHLQTNIQVLFSFIKNLWKDGINPFYQAFKKAGAEKVLSVLSNNGSEKEESSDSSDKKGFIDKSKDALTSTLDKLDGVFAAVSTSMGKVVVSTIEDGRGSNFYSVDILFGRNGQFVLRRMQPLSCTISFTNKEYDDKGFPITGKIDMRFSSHQPATVSGITDNKIDFGFET